MKRIISLFLTLSLVFTMCGCAAKVEAPSDSIALFLGDIANMEATTEDLPISYSSSDTSIVTIDKNGNIKTTGVGEAEVTATSSKGKTATRRVIVSHIEPTELALSNTSKALDLGDNLQLRVAFTPVNTTDTSVEWTSSNTSVASVSSNGVVLAQKEGKAVITATSSNNFSALCSITVVEDILQRCYLDAVSVIHDNHKNNDGFEILGDIIVYYSVGVFYVQVNFRTGSDKTIRKGFAAFNDDGTPVPGAIYDNDSTGEVDQLINSFVFAVDNWELTKRSFGYDVIDGKNIANILGYSYRNYTCSERRKIDAVLTSSDNMLKNGTVDMNAIVNATIGEKNALKAARSYLKTGNFSYSGLVDQLMFSGYSMSDAIFAVDNCGADWYLQAALMAQSYMSMFAFSCQRLISQLEFSGFN